MAQQNCHATYPRTRPPQFEAVRQRADTTTEYEDRCRSEALAALELEGVEIVHDAKGPKVLGTGAYGSVIELRFRGRCCLAFILRLSLVSRPRGLGTSLTQAVM